MVEVKGMRCQREEGPGQVGSRGLYKEYGISGKWSDDIK